MSSDYVWALVCGYPTPHRQKRLLMVLNAYVDDSMTHGQVLILGGYIASAAKWAQFSDDWQEVLDMSPRLAAHHMNEVDLSSERQFERTGWFYRVIEKHVQAAIVCAVNIEDLNSVVQSMHLPDNMRNPYPLAIKLIINLLSVHQNQLGIDEPVDFIFDERSEKKIVRDGFETMLESAPPEFRRLIGGDPVFKDDTKVLPLQAADLFAWCMRKFWMQEGGLTSYPLLPWARDSNLPILALDANRSEIVEEFTLRLKAIASKSRS